MPFPEKNCRSRCLHDGIVHEGMHTETQKIHLPKASEVSSPLALTASQSSFLRFLLWCVRLKIFFLQHVQPAISIVYCFSFKLKHAQKDRNPRFLGKKGILVTRASDLMSAHDPRLWETLSRRTGAFGFS